VILSKVTTLVESTDGNNTSKAKLSFNLSGEKNDSSRGKRVDLNPFEVLNGENKGGWTF
jgi:hypothetical protein